MSYFDAIKNKRAGKMNFPAESGHSQIVSADGLEKSVYYGVDDRTSMVSPRRILADSITSASYPSASVLIRTIWSAQAANLTQYAWDESRGRSHENANSRHRLRRGDSFHHSSICCRSARLSQCEMEKWASSAATCKPTHSGRNPPRLVQLGR